MREISVVRLALLNLLLLAVIILLYGFDRIQERTDTTDLLPLQQSFAVINGWSSSRNIPLSSQMTSELQLDDYLFRTFRKGPDAVTLYIGYYRTAKKVGAAHDPLVCFLGQGWDITNREQGVLILKEQPDLRVSYSSMITEREADKELVVYWFQTNGDAEASTIAQKLKMIKARILGDRERNAFVRISAPLDERSPEAVRHRIFAFIEDFYPEFYRYVTEGGYS